MATELGCVGIRVGAKTDAIGFYKRFGFALLETSVMAEPVEGPSQLQHLFLPIDRIQDAMEPRQQSERHAHPSFGPIDAPSGIT